MPSQTPALKMPYPVGSDPVADGDNAIRALAERIESFGILGYAELTTAPATTPPQTMLTVPGITHPAGRRLRVSAYASLYISGAAAQVEVSITTVNAAGTRLARWYAHLPTGGSATANMARTYIPGALSAVTFCLNVVGPTGLVLVGEAVNPVWLMVEDVGPSIIT